MNKQEFLRRIKEDLSSLTDEELQNALKYYDEYFADSHEEEVEQGITEYNLIEDLKEDMAAVKPVVHPQENYTHAGASDDASEIKKPRSSNNTMKLVLLICFSPIWVPLVMAAAMVLFSLFMAFLSVSVAIGCAAISGFIAAGAGVFSIGYGIMQLFLSGWNIGGALYYISTGLIITGIGIILAYIFGKLTFIMLKYEFKFLGFIGRKIFKPARQGA